MSEPEFVRCPQCSTVIRTNHPRYPRCPKCKEFLRKHRYCEHLEAVTQECTHPEIVRPIEQRHPEARATIADLDEHTQCPYFESMLGHLAPTRLQRLLGPVVRVSLITAIVAVVMLHYFQSSVRQYEAVAQHTELEFEVICPDTTYAEQTFEVQCVVRNRDEKEAKTVELRLNERVFDWFELLDVSPPPRDMRVVGAGRYLQYGNLAGKSEMLVQLRLRGTQVGSYELAVQLRSPGQFQSKVMHYPIDVM
jgi:ribosomal protein L32